MWRFFLVLLTAAVLCKETSAACGPVEEGQTTTLTCTVSSVDCGSWNPRSVLRWDAARSVSSTFIAQCTQSVCSGIYIDNNLPITISGTSSTLTITSVSRTSPFNMETEWRCTDLCNSQTKTVCTKLVIYAKPENPSCTMREDTQSGDIKSVTVTCSTTKVYPRAKCSFERIKDGDSPVTTSQNPTYNHPPTAGTSAVYYMSECSVTVPVSNLGEGTHSFQGYIYPDVAGGRNLVDVTTVPGTVTLKFPVNDADKSDGDKDLIIIIMGVVAVVIIAALVVVIIILVRRFSSNKETRNANSKQTSAPTDMSDTRTDDDGYLEPGLATGPSYPLSLTDHNQYEEMPDRMSTFRQYNSLAGQNTDPPTSYNTLRSVSATPSASSTTTANGTYIAMVPHSTTTNGRNATYNNPMASASAKPLANVTDQTQNDNYINVDQPRTTDNENGQLKDRKPYENVNVYASITDA